MDTRERTPEHRREAVRRTHPAHGTGTTGWRRPEATQGMRPSRRPTRPERPSATSGLPDTAPGHLRATLRGRRLRDWILDACAVGGALCILSLVASVLLGVSVMVFKTGSMSPTIPTGSAAIVREVPASQVRVGEVVTVSLGEGRLPVTHRVTAIGEDPANPGQYLLRMRGDANEVEDPVEYRADTVRRVWFSVPGAGRALVALAEPRMLFAVTLVMSALVTWTCWPGSQARHRGRALRRRQAVGRHTALAPSAGTR